MKYLPSILIAFCSTAMAADWEAISQKHMNSQEFVQYKVPLALHFHKLIGPAIKLCSKPNASPFKLYLKMNASGTVLEAYATPTTPMTKCFANEFSKAALPAPPFSPFVLGMDFFK